MKNWFFRGVEQVQQPGQPAICRDAGCPSVSSDCRSAASSSATGTARAPAARAARPAARGRARAARPRPARPGPGRQPGRERPLRRPDTASERQRAQVWTNAQPTTAAEPISASRSAATAVRRPAEDAGGFAPVGERTRVDPRADVARPRSSRSSRRSSRGPQLGHGLVPLADDLRRRRGEQPGGQRLLAGPGPRRAEPLEQRAVAEQVEVGRIGVIEVEEPLPRDPGPGPGAVDPLQPLLVELGPAPGGLPGVPTDPLMHRDQATNPRERPDDQYHAIEPAPSATPASASPSMKTASRASASARPSRSQRSCLARRSASRRAYSAEGLPRFPRLPPDDDPSQ